MTSQALISKIHCTLFSQSEKRSMWVSSMYNNRRTKLPFILVLSSNCFCYNVLCVAMVVVLNVYILIFVLFGLSRRHKWADDCKHFNEVITLPGSSLKLCYFYLKEMEQRINQQDMESSYNNYAESRIRRCQVNWPEWKWFEKHPWWNYTGL